MSFKLAIMSKKSKINYIAIPLCMCALLFVALYSNPVLDKKAYSTEGLKLNFTVSEDIALLANGTADAKVFTTNQTVFPQLGKSFVGFKEALGFKESGGNYFRVNSLGYLGKYQFGAETLKLIGIYNSNQFLYNPELQEKAFLANAERNKWILRKDIKRYVGKTINGVNVTESGILAAAHLAGPGSVKKYLRSYGSNNLQDAYGTSVRAYMKKFSGYDTSAIMPNKKAKAIL